MADNRNTLSPGAGASLDQASQPLNNLNLGVGLGEAGRVMRDMASQVTGPEDTPEHVDALICEAIDRQKRDS